MGKIGAMVPTKGRPDLLRFCLLQLMVQSLRPDVVVVHQNGDEENYSHIIEDMDLPFHTEWIFNPNTIPQHEWYRVPLKRLIELECDYYFWIDHDDIYRRSHIEVCLKDLKKNDFRVSYYSSLLVVDKNRYKFAPEFQFRPHAAAGQSSSMAFNRKFAECLLKDIENDKENVFTDNVLAKVTMPKFKCARPKNTATTTYVSHRGSISSYPWVDDILGP